MGFLLQISWLLIALLISSVESKSCSRSSKLHSKTYKSVPFSLRPGDVQDRFYRMEFPSGHIGVKNFMGEVVDELGIPVPLSEVYLHHWVVFQLYVPASEVLTFGNDGFGMKSSTSKSNIKVAGNQGICQHQILSQFWGLGSETRHTDYKVPDPYAIVVGDRAKVPDGYEEVWYLNIHAIAIKGTEDPQGCLECRCDLYNVTKDERGKPLPDDYRGGLGCCYEGTRCKVTKGNQEPERKLYLQYTIEWLDWDECVEPVQAYIFDVTDTGERDATDRKVGCKIEYEVPACNKKDNDCVHIMKNSVVIPKGGNLVYAVAHQHSGAQGMVLHGENGRHVCSSIPTYGQGLAAGDEAGHIVGMSTCYPRIGDVSLGNGENIHLTSYYNSTRGHTGVMALFYVLVTEDIEPEVDHFIKNTPKTGSNTSLIFAAVGLVVLAAVFGIYIGNKLESREFYEPI